MSGRGRWALGAALLLWGTGLPSVGTSWAAPAGADGGIPVVQVNGRGFGHGVGMAQDGELEMGRQGDSLETILGQFYPGTSLARAGGTIRVVVLAASPTRTTLAFPQGGQVQDAYSGAQSPGFPLKVPAGDEVVVSLRNGTYTAALAGGVSAQSASPAVTVPGPTTTTTTSTPPSTTTTRPGSTTTTTFPFRGLVPTTTSTTSPRLPQSSTTTTQPVGPAPTTTTTAPSGTGPSGTTRANSTRPLWLVPNGGGVTSVVATGRRYRGVIEAVGAGAGGTDLDLVNQLGVEAYLRGMGEVQDPSWPPASLQAQAVIERTYALRAMQAAGEICDDTRCQVYLGQQAEYAAQDQAVSSTAGKVLAYQGSLAATVFSANAGGFTATPQEGFGPEAGDFPYLRAAPYPTYDADPWSVTVSLADVASRLDYPGSITSAAVSTTGPSGRALTVVLLGSAAPASVSGVDFAASLGLRSTLFQIYDTVAAAAPAPPPPAQAGQALPTDAAALEAAASTPVAISGVGGGGPGRHRGRRAGSALAAAGGRGTGGWGWLALAVLLVVAGAGGASAWRGRLFRRFAWTRRRF